MSIITIFNLFYLIGFWFLAVAVGKELMAKGKYLNSNS